MFGKFSVHAWGAIIPRGAKMRMAPMSRCKCSCFKPPHQFQACAENLHNIESFVCKITNSRLKLWLNYRTYVILDNLTKVKKTTHTHTHTQTFLCWLTDCSPTLLLLAECLFELPEQRKANTFVSGDSISSEINCSLDCLEAWCDQLAFKYSRLKSPRADSQRSLPQCILLS